MFKLISIELTKIFKKKFIYIIYIILLLFIILNNIIIINDKSKYNLTNDYEDTLLLLNNTNINKNYNEYASLLSKVKVLEYDIKHHIESYNPKTISYLLPTTLEDYELFIVITSVVITSSLIAGEYNNDTIKNNIMYPYSRTIILLSKISSSLIILFLSIIVLYMLNLTVSSLFLSLKTITQKIIIYNIKKTSIVCYNIIVICLIRILASVPLYLILISFTSLLSIITNKEVISIIISLIIYIFKDTIYNLSVSSKIYIFRYLITNNLNFKEYLFGNLSTYSYINLNFSILIFIIYLIIFLSLSIYIFNIKDIKNS